MRGQIYLVVFELILCFIISVFTYMVLRKDEYHPSLHLKSQGSYFSSEQETELYEFSKSPASHVSHSIFVDIWKNSSSILAANLVNVLTWAVLLVTVYKTTKADILIFYRAPSAILLLVGAFQLFDDQKDIEKLLRSDRYKGFTMTKLLPVVEYVKVDENKENPPLIVLDDGSELVRQDLISTFPPLTESQEEMIYAGYAAQGKELVEHKNINIVVVMSILLGIILLIEGVVGRYVVLDELEGKKDQKGSKNSKGMFSGVNFINN